MDSTEAETFVTAPGKPHPRRKSPVKQMHATIISNNEILPGMHLLWLQAPNIATSAQPGQFVMVQCGNKYDHVLRRPLSIHRVKQKQLALLFNIVGQGTEWLAHRREGDQLDLLGPMGNGFSIQPNSRTLLLAAGGVGIAPLAFLAEKAVTKQTSISLLLGTKTAVQIYPKSMLPRRIDLSIVTEDGSEGQQGLITDILPDLIDQADEVFACGPIPMYKTMASQIDFKGKPVQISLEERMGCGLGICYGCTIKTRQGQRQLCTDGPILKLEDLIWD